MGGEESLVSAGRTPHRAIGLPYQAVQGSWGVFEPSAAFPGAWWSLEAHMGLVVVVVVVVVAAAAVTIVVVVVVVAATAIDTATTTTSATAIATITTMIKSFFVFRFAYFLLKYRNYEGCWRS